jgi:hypothetical protein
MPADGVICVSIPKSGTHLIAGLLKSLGYTVRGEGGEPLGESDRRDCGYHARRLGLLPEVCNADSIAWQKAADDKWIDVNCPWEKGQALVIHELPLDRIDGDLYRQIFTTGEPKLIFNYRDPRACVVSYVHFLRDRNDFTPTPIQLYYSAVLRKCDSFGDALAFAVADPQFPVWRSFRTCRWLFEHPRVLKTRYGYLVGQQGGGTEADQTYEIEAVVDFLDCHDSLYSDPYSENAKTFRLGKIYGWTQYWTPAADDFFLELHSDLLPFCYR